MEVTDQGRARSRLGVIADAREATALHRRQERRRAGSVKTQNGKFALAGEGLPRDFTGGTITQVIVDVSGEPDLDLEKEALAVLSRE